MKTLLYLVLILFITTSVFGQETSDESTIKKFRRIQLDIFSDNWDGLPTDINFEDFNVGVNLYYSYPFVINENFGFAIGGGFSWHNLYSNGIPMEMTDSVSGIYAGTQFMKIPNGTIYKKNKMALTYFDIPVEFRIKTYETKKFRFAIGGKLGFLLSARNKYKGEQMTGDFQSFSEKVRLKHIHFFRYGITSRIGYGMWNFYVFYSLSELFVHPDSPTMIPLSFGISILMF